MSKGVLFVAFDAITDQDKVLRYTESAKIAATLVRKHLKLPVGVISDNTVDGFDEQIIVEKKSNNNRHVLIDNKHESYNWFNDYRRQLYNLTPWKQTLLLDADYFLQSDQYLKCFEFNRPFQIVKQVYDPTGRNSFDKYKRLPNRSIPQVWATAMYWNQDAKIHFDYANMIAENYEYYANIFEFPAGQFRNDMIFSIVAHLLTSYEIAWPMWMVSSDCELIDANSDGLKFKYDSRVIRIKNDLHLLNKNIMLDKNLDLLHAWSKLND